MKSLSLSFCLLIAIGLVSCTGSKKAAETQSDLAYMSAQQHLVQSNLYVQQAGEFRALSWQAFALAKIRLDEGLATLPAGKKAAVIVDVDETVLDNSPYSTHNITSGKPFNLEDWQSWTEMANADSLPGSVAFLRYADSKGVAVYYITNRRIEEEPATIENLKKLNFPQVNGERVLTREAESSKAGRRQYVADKHEIILLVGDALTDFSEDFENLEMDERRMIVDKYQQEFGDKYIVMPNPLYGGWEGAAMQGRRDWSIQQKDSLRKAALRGYE